MTRTQDVTIFNENGNLPVDVVNEGGLNKLAVTSITDVSSQYTELSVASKTKTLAKGIRNEIDIFPFILGENMERTDDRVKALNGTNTDVGQVFRLTTGTDNICAISIALDAISTNDVTIDDFESYANEAALDSAWVQSDNVNTPASLETTVVSEGSQSMKIDITKSASKEDTITKSFTAEDWSNSSGIRLRFMNSNTKNEIELRISDGTNTSKKKLTSSGQNVWDTLILNFSDFTSVTASLADLTSITSIQFYVKKADITSQVYIDKIERLAGSYGTVDVELYDFGTTANPTSLGTPLTFDNGNTKETITLSGGANDYFITNIQTGVTGTALTQDHYYGINITNKSDSAVTLYCCGSTSNNYYSSGFAYFSTDNGTSITEITNNDLGFQVYYNDECYHDAIILSTDLSSGDSDFIYFVEDESNEKIINMIVPIERTNNRTEIKHNWKQEHSNPIFVAKGKSIELKYNDDSSSSATRIEFTTINRFKKRTIHG